MRFAIKISRLLRHPLVIAVCSGLIAGIVGTFIAYQFNKDNLEKQMQLELYKDLIHQQSQFVDHLTKDIYTRVYKLSAYFSSLKSGDNEKIKESWLKYREETVAWSGELRFYLTNLDRYFPKEEFYIGDYAPAKELFCKNLDRSFKWILENDIQPRFYNINNTLNDFNRAIFARGIEENQMKILEKEIDKLYKRVYEFTEALSRASISYKVSAKTRLLKENF